MPYVYHYMFGNYSIDSPIPKLVIYTTHDEIVGAFFEGLDWHQTAGVYPAGALYIEFFKETTEND